jgi:hypothetical protein
MKTYFKPREYKPRNIKIRQYSKRPFSYKRAEVEHDFLKYIKVVRAWVRIKHKWSYSDFELISFLYSEHIFDECTLMQYGRLFGFNQNRVPQMIERGLINVFRKGGRGFSPMYELSASAKGIMRSVYKKLLGQEPINEFVTDIQLAEKKDSRYIDRQYTRVIKRMKSSIKEQQQRPEL